MTCRLATTSRICHDALRAVRSAVRCRPMRAAKRALADSAGGVRPENPASRARSVVGPCMRGVRKTAALPPRTYAQACPVEGAPLTPQLRGNAGHSGVRCWIAIAPLPCRGRWISSALASLEVPRHRVQRTGTKCSPRVVDDLESLRMHVRIRLVPPSRRHGPRAGLIPAPARSGLSKHFARFRLWEPSRKMAGAMKLTLARRSPRD
jgi:hypothetical protein